MRKPMPKTFTLLASSALLVAAASSAQAQEDRSDWPDNWTVGTASQGGT